MLKDLMAEFKGLTNNQAYELAFNSRLLRPDPSRPGRFLGNTQREDFLQILSPLLEHLPAKAQIFDVGAGAGEIVDFALGQQVGSAIVNLEEPNSILLAKYIERIQNSSNLELGSIHHGPLQDYYTGVGEPSRPSCPSQQDLVLAIHMIYHLTDFRNDRIDPDADLVQAVSTMYSCLKPGGALFVVCANQLISTSGRASRFYFAQKGDSKTVQNLNEICASRDRLLAQGLVATYLDRAFADSKATVVSYATNSYLYGNSREDIAAMCLTGELGEADDKAFDLEKLEILTKFIDTQAIEIGLTIEERSCPQIGMLRVNQPQIVAVITRNGN